MKRLERKKYATIRAIYQSERGDIVAKKDLHAVLFGGARPSKWKTIPLKYRVSCLALTAALVLSALFTYMPRRNPAFPGWDTIYRKAGLYGETSKLYDLPLCVTFIDVGQGDCTLVKAGRSFLLIDAGNPGNEKRIQEEMKRQGCQNLDYVIATHPHADHIGSFPELFPEIPVNHIILPEMDPALLEDPGLYEIFLSAVHRSRAHVILAQPGKKYTLGKASFQVLGPVQRSDNANNMSVVVRLTYKEISFLFAGDAESEEEYDILRTGLPVRSSVLKCGHHGSRTSTSLSFLHAVSPKTAVISCGKDNDYGHPNSETVEKLQEAGVKILRTDRQGTIVVGTQGKKIWYS